VRLDSISDNVAIGTNSSFNDSKVTILANGVSGIHCSLYPYITGVVDYNAIIGQATCDYIDPEAMNTGVMGTAAYGNLNFGIYGQAYDSSDQEKHGNYGVFGEARAWGSASPAKCYGIYGLAPIPGWAGYFNGNVNVTDTIYSISVQSGVSVIQIDHPLDKANKFLSHSSVISPDMKTIYDGISILDDNGEATVQLPDYFQALNEDFRYQLTCIGAYSPIYIAGEITNNQFAIAGGKPGAKVSWQVTGIRKDEFAKENRIQVVAEKPVNLMGRFLHPEAFGYDSDLRIYFNKGPKEKRAFGPSR